MASECESPPAVGADADPEANVGRPVHPNQEPEVNPADPGVSPADPEVNLADPMDIGRHRRKDVSSRQMHIEYPNGNRKKLKKYYVRQNELIDNFLGAEDEERVQRVSDDRYAPKIKFATYASFTCNFCLLAIQLFAAISTNSLALFATAADAFMDLLSSSVMLIASKLAARPSVYKYPVGRRRIETIGVILFSALMTTVSIQLLVESARTLGEGPKEPKPLQIVPLVCVGVAILAKSSLMIYCFFYRRFPSVHVFFLDHRNDVAINSFGLIASILGDRFVWYLDPMGAMLIAVLILFSWVSNASDQVWLLVGKSAPREYISKLIYLVLTHDPRIQKVDTCRAYHSGQQFYVEVDVVMNQDLPLKVTHDCGQTLQRKLEGLQEVERAFVHIDYEHEHDIHEEHKPLYSPKKKKRSFLELIRLRKPR